MTITQNSKSNNVFVCAFGFSALKWRFAKKQGRIDVNRFPILAKIVKTNTRLAGLAIEAVLIENLDMLNKKIAEISVLRQTETVVETISNPAPVAKTETKKSVPAPAKIEDSHQNTPQSILESVTSAIEAKEKTPAKAPIILDMDTLLNSNQ